MKDTCSSRASYAQKMPISGLDGRRSASRSLNQRNADQLKKIVAAQTAQRWTKIIRFPQNQSSPPTPSATQRTPTLK